MTDTSRFYDDKAKLDLLDLIRLPIVRNIIKHQLEGYEDPVAEGLAGALNQMNNAIRERERLNSFGTYEHRERGERHYDVALEKLKELFK